jgi:chemotaxis protein methyltransferase CheR
MGNANSTESSMVMNDVTFNRFSTYIHDEMGIKMSENKRVMLQARLLKRIRALKLPSFEAYQDYLFSPAGHQNELADFVHEVTTNKTDFFREPNHFTYLIDQALPTLFREGRSMFHNPLQVWSSACSTGEEPYTLAMFLDDYGTKNQGFTYSVLATDISTTVLREARKAIYDEQRIAPIPVPMRKKYILRSKNRENQQVRIIPELRSHVEFRWTNLKDPKLTPKEKMDVIFCRNVIIYFDRETQELVLNNLCNHLLPGGFVFMGHSENLNGLKIPLTQVASTVYRKN